MGIDHSNPYIHSTTILCDCGVVTAICFNVATYSILFFPFSADEAYREGDIHLVGGSYNWEGRVEIYWTGTWGTISDTSWSNSDAEVVCRQLGHSTNSM